MTTTTETSAADSKEIVPMLVPNASPPEEQKKYCGLSLAIFLKYLSLLILVLQNAGLVIVLRYASSQEEKFTKTVLILFSECMKFVAATVLFFITESNVVLTLKELKRCFITEFWDFMKLGIPAIIYFLQNLLLLVAIANLESTTYMVSYQLKVLTTAAFTVTILKRKLSLWQWLSLVVLITGVALVNFNESDKSAKKDHENNLVGFLSVGGACCMSGFAGIYIEKILKTSPVSVWVRNMQLSLLTIPFACVFIAIKDHQSVLDRGLLYGFNHIAWIAVLVQAVGGLIVSVVIKYADNILKGFATTIAIIVGSIASVFVFNYVPTLFFLIGATLVIVAVIVYSSFPYKVKESTDSDADIELNDSKSTESESVKKSAVNA